MNYAIFRTNPIYTLPDLAQIGAHNKREKKAYNSNKDIDINKSHENITLVPLNDKYVKGFYEKTIEYRKQHEEKIKTEREDRKKTFNQMINGSKNVVADEYIMTASNDFFKDKSKEEIKKWANTCMDFIYNDLGYKKEQILHAVVHMDELTPHIHCVAIPLVKKYDKRTNSERYTISKKQYIKDKIHLSELQDKYHERLVNNGFDLERGIKGSDSKHIRIKEFKKITKNLNQTLNTRNKKLDQAMEDLEEKMKESKTTLLDKEYIKVKKDTFNSMSNIIKETKKTMEIQPKLEHVFKEVSNYTNSYKTLEKENRKYENEIENLKEQNNILKTENNNLRDYIRMILEVIKKFFRKMLKLGNEETKDLTTSEIKEYYDQNDFNKYDIKDIAINTDREEELFKYANINSYKYEYDYNDKEKDDYEL